MSQQSATDNSVKIYNPAATLKPITATPAAIAHIKKKLRENGKGIGLRLGVKKAGCSGLEYVIDYVEAKQANDEVFIIEEGLGVYVNKADLIYVHGTEIDYVQKGIAGGELRFNNPNAKVSCGCGESFNI